MNKGQLAVFVIPRQILKKGQGHLQITEKDNTICCDQYITQLDRGQGNVYSQLKTYM